MSSVLLSSSSSSSSSSSVAANRKKGHSGIWIEKYRPQGLEDVISHDAIIGTISRLIESGRLPHLLFYGPAGVGKTSTIMACAQKMYGPSYRSMILELNASDDRGIGVVRDEIKTFASTRKIFSSGVKLVILDEADSLTKDAQAALRRVIEKYTRSTRFCFICNYVNKIIPALQSRCTRFRFSPLKEEQILPRLQQIIEAEAVPATPAGIHAVVRLAGGDMRKCLNILQSAYMSFSTVDENSVYRATGHPSPQNVDQIVHWLLNEEFASAFAKIHSLMGDQGYALQDVLTEVYRIASQVKFPPRTLAQLFIRLAKIEDDLSRGSSEKLQLASLVGLFQIAKESVMVQDDISSPRQ
ncbi:MAG: replication factor C small subunit [archaeon]|nr:replication factor C small subunit [archaeon]